jgi:hypothetical protein
MFCFLPWFWDLYWFISGAKIRVLDLVSTMSSGIILQVVHNQYSLTFGISGKFTDLCSLPEPDVPLIRSNGSFS